MSEKVKLSEEKEKAFQYFCERCRISGMVSVEDALKNSKNFFENFTNGSNVKLESGKDEVTYTRSDIINKFDKVFIELITEDGISINKENMLRRFRREFVQSIK